MEEYNYQELKTELKGLVTNFKDRLRGSFEFLGGIGEDSVLSFNGMFAFSIWDTKDRELFF